MPNRDAEISLTAPWQNFRVSLDAVQAATGLNLLSDIDPAVKAAIETQVDNQ
jgi:endonuclease G